MIVSKITGPRGLSNAEGLVVSLWDIRTPDLSVALWVKSRTLYQTELRAHEKKMFHLF